MTNEESDEFLNRIMIRITDYRTASISHQETMLKSVNAHSKKLVAEHREINWGAFMENAKQDAMRFMLRVLWEKIAWSNFEETFQYTMGLMIEEFGAILGKSQEPGLSGIVVPPPGLYLPMNGSTPE